MSDHKAIAERMYREVIEGGNLDVIDEIVHEDLVEHEETPGMPTRGREAPRAFVKMFHDGFSDISVTIDEMVEEGDMLAVRSTFSGTHTGEFMGMAPTGNRMEVAVFDMVRIQDGQAIEHWGLMDAVTMMQQLGVMPGPPAG